MPFCLDALAGHCPLLHTRDRWRVLLYYWEICLFNQQWPVSTPTKGLVAFLLLIMSHFVLAGIKIRLSLPMPASYGCPPRVLPNPFFREYIMVCVLVMVSMATSRGMVEGLNSRLSISNKIEISLFRYFLSTLQCAHLSMAYKSASLRRIRFLAQILKNQCLLGGVRTSTHLCIITVWFFRLSL